MSNTLITDRDLEVGIDSFLQYATPGILEGCTTIADAEDRIQRIAKLETRNEYKDGYVLVDNDINYDYYVLCILRLSIAKAFKDSQCDFSTATLIWIQENFSFDSGQARVHNFPFRSKCLEWKAPF